MSEVVERDEDDEEEVRKVVGKRNKPGKVVKREDRDEPDNFIDQKWGDRKIVLEQVS